MAGKVKMGDLHKLIDLLEAASEKTSNTLSLSIMAYSNGGFGVSLMDMDIKFDENGEPTSEVKFHKDFNVEYEWSSIDNASVYKECRDYLKRIIEEGKDNG